MNNCPPVSVAAASTTDVRPGMEFDERRLAEYLAAHVPGFAGPLSVRQFKGGQSNPTYLLATPGRHYVLRRKPPGTLLASAHAVDREYRVIRALGEGSEVPVPRAYALCTDDAVIGTWFYVMEFVEGRILWDPALLEVERGARRAHAFALVATLATLHRVDPVAVGLGDFGKPEGFNARQLRRMRSLIAVDGAVPEPFAELDGWLHAHLPPESRIAIVHNDFRIGNMIVNMKVGSIAAILDWELATIGDPLADLGYFLTSYPGPGEPLVPTSAMGTAVLEPGYPGRAEVLDRYVDRTGADVSRVNWYAALAMYKLAALYEYSRRRFESGVGDPYYADPGLVSSFLAAGERLAANDSALT